MSEIGRRIENAASTAYDQAVTDLRSRVNGDDLERSDKTTYSYSDPIDAFVTGWKDVAKSLAERKVAMNILEVQKADGLTVEEATRRAIKRYDEGASYGRGMRHGDSLREVISVSEYEYINKFIGELRQLLSFEDSQQKKYEERISNKLGKLIETMGPMGPAQTALGVVLLDPSIRPHLDPMALRQSLAVFGLTIEKIKELVDQDIEREKADHLAKMELNRIEREKKLANRCQENVYDSYRSYHQRKCERAGRYLVTYSDGTEVRLCGTHLKSKSKYNSDAKNWKVVDTKEQVTA